MEEKVFRYPGTHVLAFGIPIFAAFLMGAVFSDEVSLLLVLGPIAILFGFMFLHALIHIIVDDNEITVATWYGSKSLYWTEITSVSSRWERLRLTNMDSSVTLALDPNVSNTDDGDELLDLVLAKRPDLFDVPDGFSVSRNIFLWPLIFIVGAFMVFLGHVSSELFLGLIIFFVLFGFSDLISGPYKMELQNSELQVKYIFRTSKYTPQQISTVSLEKESFRKRGNFYFTRFDLADGRSASFSIGRSNVLTYLILKRWHEKARAKPA